MTLPQPMPFFSAAADFAAGSDTPRAFLERCLARLAEFEPAVGAFVCHDIAAARVAADRSAARWRDGRPLSPIDGMPLGIKDIIETADMPTEQGSPLFVGWRTGRDAASVAALREAGAVILGKVVTTEFAATEPRGTRNPWDTRAHAGRIEQRLRRRGRLRHGPGGARDPGRRLDPASGELLRRCRLQAERRRDQSRRQLRLFQPELHRRARRLARRRLARRGQHRRAGRRRSGLSRAARPARAAAGAAPARPRRAANLRMGGLPRPRPGAPSRRRRHGWPKPGLRSPTVMPIPSSRKSRARFPMRPS